ncbi:MAG: CpaF family protein, partial [Chloroflexi bacterium]|nr:CpaF family protein [Chloroflexota bacterium]
MPFLGRRTERPAAEPAPTTAATAAPVAPNQVEETPSVDTFSDLKVQIHERLIADLDMDRLRKREPNERRQAVETAIGALIDAHETPLGRSEKLRLTREIADEVLGLGPLETLLQDPTITEVMVNGARRIFFERKGLIHRSRVVFRDDAHVMRIIEKIIAPLGRRLDESSPMVDARLADGSRVNAIIPPLAVDGPSITIRKFAKIPLKAEDLVDFGTLTEDLVFFLSGAVRARLNILVSGGTGSGKTTLLNVLSSFIPHNERIVTVEDPCELQLQQPHVVRLETRPPNIEGKGEVAQRQLVRNALRMRPDRIVVGEVRGGEAFDMLQAMNTGHDGSLTTAHANTPRDALARIENMVLMANYDLPVRAVREQIASAIQLIVHIGRLRDGTRKLTHVTEIVGMEGEVITLQDLFLF